jgi:DNA-directed RNA polymerase II subunit RPB2
MSAQVQAALNDNDATKLAKEILHKYFQTHSYPFTFHHTESFNQFLSEDLPNLIQSYNPITLLNKREDVEMTTEQGDKVRVRRYKYKVEIYVGGEDGKGIYVGTPTLSLENSEVVRVLLPNEARLRNLSYASTITADVLIKLTIMIEGQAKKFTIELKDNNRLPLFQMPILLHSKYCLLHNKPAEFLREVGECEYDYGGYFIIDGAEKILVTRQEKAFNTLVVSVQKSDPKVAIFSKIICLNPKSHLVKNVTFQLMRNTETILVSLPFIRKPVPLFAVFRALGLQSDEDILRQIFPDADSAEAKLLTPYLIPSIVEAHPFVDTFSAIEFMKTLTKGFSKEHVIDILFNQTFIHIENRPNARIAFLAECVRKILRVYTKIDQPTDRDDIRNQRCLTSGFACQMLLQGIYKLWVKQVRMNIDRAYNENISIYENEDFVKIFDRGNRLSIFNPSMLNEQVTRAFHGKWSGSVGESKDGNLQSLSRLSYHDFLSHCRRINLEFDTGKKDPGPRRLHPSQFGYYCTNETPTGASIGITKNLSILTAISTALQTKAITEWLYNPKRGQLIPCHMMTDEINRIAVPLFLNGGILGYTLKPQQLTRVLRLMKRSGYLPAYASVGFSIDERRVFLYLDEGRPLRPLIYIENGQIPLQKLEKTKDWRHLIMGSLEDPKIANRQINDTYFIDPLASNEFTTPGINALDEYERDLKFKTGAIEYIDPYEHNLLYIAMYPKYKTATTTHIEIHPSTIMGMMTNMVPFAHHNQSPRNQLSCSQSKQGLSIFSTKYRSRFDNNVHVLSYGEAPLARTIYYDYVADGNIGYGHNLILAIGSFTGYNQDDGILMNKDSFERGLFRNMSFRSYAACEYNDPDTKAQIRIAHPRNVPGWTDLANGLDYSKLNEDGIIDTKKHPYVDQNTVLVSMYMVSEGGIYSDVSVTPQVWTNGRVDDISVTVDNNNLRMVKIRITQDRIPELGDKFSNRHGQKGTIGIFIPGRDMPRTKEGIVPDMIMNPHAIPSRMTIAQLLETILGKAASLVGAIGNATSFMNDGDPTENIGAILQSKGYEKYGNEILYDGTTGVQIPSAIFIGQCYTMRLKHMTQDKWNARGAGRKEMRTHQPTGGRGNEGGLRIGEMERDAIAGHGVTEFLQESYMKRSDETEFTLCNGCGTVPITNPGENLQFCPLCDGPAFFSGSKADDLTLIPPNKRSSVTFSKVKMPFASYLLTQELTTYLNMGTRFLTTANVERLRQPSVEDLMNKDLLKAGTIPLKTYVIQETTVPTLVSTDQEVNLGVADEEEKRLVDEQQSLAAREQEESVAIEAAVNAAANAQRLGLNADGTQVNIKVQTAAPVGNSPVVLTNPSAFFPAAVATPSVQVPVNTQGEASPMTTTNYTMTAAPDAQAVVNQMSAPPPPPPAPASAVASPSGNTMMGGFQPLAQRQITETYAPPPEAQIYPPILPGAPPNIVVATDPISMMAAGLRGIPTGTVSRSNNIAPKTIGSQEGGSNPNAKITVIRQG